MSTSSKQRRVTLFVNPLILKQARAQAVVEEITLSAIVGKALTSYLPKETVIKNIQVKGGGEII